MLTRLKNHFRPLLEELESRLVLSTFFVDTNAAGASDANNGLSGGAAWKTLQHAANMVEAGDTVIVRAGNYKGFQLETDGTSAAQIIFRADPGTIINQAANSRGHGINLEGASWITIEGFRVEGGGGAAITRAGIRSVENDHVTIRNNISNANGYWGILTGYSDYVTIEGNTTTNSVNEHGIYVSNSCINPIIRNNTIFGNRANGIHMNGDRFTDSATGKPLTGIITGALVEGNVIHNNGVGGGSGINGDGVQNSLIRNNLVYNTHASGISLYQIDGAQGSKNNTVVNNTILVSSTGRWALNISGGSEGSTGNTVFNNIFWSDHSFRGAISITADSLAGFRSDNNAGEDRYSIDGGNSVLTLAQWRTQTGQDANSLVATQAQLFLNPAGADYHLSSTSPARDRGIGTFNGKSAPTVDREGRARPSGSAYDIGAYEFVTTSSPGTLQFSAASYSVNENGTSATITVTRTGGSDGSVSVQYTTSNGTAAAGSDYTTASGALTFGTGETSKTFTVLIANDALLEGNESINLTLSNPTGGATLGAQATAVLTVTDDEAAQPGVLQFSAASYSVNENGATATITVTRTGGSNVAVNVNYATSNGSATAGADYTAKTGTLSFAVGETSKTFTVSITNDALLEGNEAINLTLSSPTGGAALGAQSTAVLTIADDETAQPGVLQFSGATYNVNENGGSVTITVTRTGGSNVAVAVNYATSNGTATAGSDYTATSGTLNFAAGETSKTFTVAVTNDSTVEANETLNLTLSSPTGGATLGSQSSAVVTIVNDDAAATTYARINFSRAGSPVPVGYLADTGSVFGNRGNGLSYGWNLDNRANARDRNSTRSPDERYDSFNHMQKNNGNFQWEIAVPNGTYQVQVVAGDANNFDSIFKINVEGVLAVNGTPTSSNRWIAGTVTVNVTDGRLTISNAAGARNNKINFVDIVRIQ
jgi:parallel beta-helix repeat protein